MKLTLWARTRPSQTPRRLTIAMVATAIVVIIVTGIGVYGLITGPPSEDPTRHPATNVATSKPTPSTAPTAASWQDIPTLPATNDPVRYARAVATAVFTWDTMSGLSPDEYRNVALIDADPSGTETAGLIADLTHYLPDIDTWQHLRDYHTRQTFTIHAAFVPDAWEHIARDAAGQIRDGTVAVTIEGTRHRHGIWHDRAEESAHDTAFTVFLACRPAFPRCHTLRLSELDNPLT
ncbi:hypothetical protein [Phytoactinopolyspora limicola]|uniref:hypothetical protein n=1 Tax=Phytoactinopolyspora limicola TaxID=2715536 RepID=UPI001408EA42|nr:hypothetical protein [Phytoactinopolyspora limicola]